MSKNDRVMLTADLVTDSGCINGDSSGVGGRIGFLAGLISTRVQTSPAMLIIPSVQLQRLESLDMFGLLGRAHVGAKEESGGGSL
jgi:hypothetical protein